MEHTLEFYKNAISKSGGQINGIPNHLINHPDSIVLLDGLKRENLRKGCSSVTERLIVHADKVYQKRRPIKFVQAIRNFFHPLTPN